MLDQSRCHGLLRSEKIPALAVVEKALLGGASKLKDKKSGQMNLFDDVVEVVETSTPITLPDIPEFGDREKSTWKKRFSAFI